MKPREDENNEITQLREELRQLERRVGVLEHAVPAPGTPRIAAASAVPAQLDIAFPTAHPGMTAAAGRAVLGLAGAYLLRALAEAGAVPRALVVAAGILYAALWLSIAFRSRSTHPQASSIYGVTTAMILAPLLWEATVRFGILTAPITAAVLFAFTALGWAAPAVPVAALGTAVALMVRTGDMAPFACAMLAVALLVETGGDRWQRDAIRIPAALAADFAVWLIVYIMTSPPELRGDYKALEPAVSVALCAGLFVISAGGIVWRLLFLRRAATFFEITQSAIAFPLAAFGILRLTQGSGGPPLGLACAAASVGCYLTRRTFFVWWGGVFGLASAFLILPGYLLTLLLGAAAGAATAARAVQPVLAIQGTLFLIAAASSADIPRMLITAFSGPSLQGATPALGVMAAAAVSCYFAWGRNPPKASLIPAAIAGLSTASLLLLLAQPPGTLIAVSRSLALSALALAFAVAASTTRRRELLWLSYAAMPVGAIKLLLEDFPHSSPAPLAVSLVCYGGLLILVPRLANRI
jgi:hypothetical protein